MANLKPFQIAIIYGSIFLGIVGLLAFAFAGPRPTKSLVIGPTVVVWGILPQSAINETIRILDIENNDKSAANQLPLNLTYEQKEESTFKNDLLEAIAAGTGPDVVLLPISSMLEQKNIIQTIAFDSYPERSYKDTFIEEGELFRQNDGYFAIPFAIDPLVMYFNKTILTQANIVTPPQYWDEVVSVLPRLTIRDTESRITRSAIALGESRNITNSKEIISALLLQAGTPITSYTYNQAIKKNQLQSSLYITSGEEGSLPPSVAAVNFFTQFADPSKSATYTWNRSLPTSQDYFAANNLALYIGFGSEVAELERKNPNLNFDMSFIPQERTNPIKSTYGNLYGLAILKNSKNVAGSFQAITSLTSNQFLKKYLSYSDLPPVRRDLLAAVPTDAYSPVRYESALKAKGWLDPNPGGTESVFMNMIESVLNGRYLPSEATQRAQLELEVLTRAVQ